MFTVITNIIITISNERKNIVIGLSGCVISHQRHKLNIVFDHHSMKRYKAKNYNIIIYAMPV